MLENEKKRLIVSIHKNLTSEQKQMILSFANGQPDWHNENWGNFPGITWKLKNINILKQRDPVKFQDQITKLEKLFQ